MRRAPRRAPGTAPGREGALALRAGPDLAGRVLALQRTAGNRAVAALLAGGAARPRLQRAIDPAARADFAVRYDRLVAQLKAADLLLPAQGDEIKALAKVAVGDGKWLEREVPHVWSGLETLMLLEDGKWDKMTPREVVATFIDTPARTYEAVTPATLSFDIEGGSGNPGGGTGGGGFAHAGMAAWEAGRIKELQDAGSDVAPLQARLEAAVDEIDRAYHAHRAAANDDAGTLERTALVFVGPEWFFRRPDRPYTQKEMSFVVDRLRAISRLYPDMVIMPGTIVWGQQAGGLWTALSNTAPVLWMGELVRLVHKAENCGDVDGLIAPAAFSSAARGHNDSRFDVANLRFALDICVDHFTRRARHEYEAVHGEKSLRKAGGVDVHIVTGAGALSDPRAVAARPGGLVIASDASGSGAKADVVTKAPDKVRVNDGGKKRHETGPTGMDELGGKRLAELQYPLPKNTQDYLTANPNPAMEAREKAKYNKAVTTLYEQVTVKVVEARKGKLLEIRKK